MTLRRARVMVTSYIMGSGAVVVVLHRLFGG